MDQTDENQFKQLIKNYMDNNQLFIDDYNNLSEMLRRTQTQILSEDNKPIVVFSHQIDINWLNRSNDHNFIEYLLKNEKLFSRLFERRLNRKVRHLLNDRRIWFCLKYKNLPENRNVKKYQELDSIEKTLFSIDSLQIVSISKKYKTLIGRKYVAQNAIASEEPIKWCLRTIRKSKFKIMENNYTEIKKERVFTEKRQIVAKLGQNSKQNGLYPIEINIFIEIFNDKQIDCIFNGSHLEAVVLFRLDSDQYVLLSFDKTFRPVCPLISDFKLFLSQFPERIQQIFEDRNGRSNYSFGLSLAFIFADKVSISGSFFRLKLGLLLSLLSVNEYPNKNLSSVLVICDDTDIIRRLFEWSSLLSKHHFIDKSLFIPMTGKKRTRLQTNHLVEWIDSGALQLGADGITILSCVSNLNDLPVKDRTALFHALETNEVIARQSQPLVPSIGELQLKSTIWAVIEDDINQKQYQPKSNRSQKTLWSQVFGMVYVVPKQTDDYKYTKPGIESTLPFSEWQQIIGLMSQIRPIMSESAENLLQQYYVTIRRIRGSNLNHISFQTLISLSKSMAKLSLRLTVTKYDALMAILLYEESLTSRLPERESPLFVKPVYHVMDDEISYAFGPECDEYMDRFENNLRQLLSKYIQNNPKAEQFSQHLSQNEE